MPKTKDRKLNRMSVGLYLSRNWPLYVMVLPAIIIALLFNYYPMYGVQIAFRNFTVKAGFWNSKWVGLKHFQRFFTTPNAKEMILNTIRISLTGTLINFPLPIVLALMLNQLRSKKQFR